MSRIRHQVRLSDTKTSAYSCFHCDTKFDATIKVVGVGEAAEPAFFGSGVAIAHGRAEEDVARELQRVHPVRCPSCDRFQPEMYKPARQSVVLPAVMGVVAVGVLATLALMFFGTGPFWGNELVWVGFPCSLGLVTGIGYAVAMKVLDPHAPFIKRRFRVGVRT